MPPFSYKYHQRLNFSCSPYRDRAKAYIKEAQLRARKQTVAQEMTNIMAEAPFNKRAEHVLGILKQLQAEKEDLQAKV